VCGGEEGEVVTVGTEIFRTEISGGWWDKTNEVKIVMCDK
jgi:hypothetical protein